MFKQHLTSIEPEYPYLRLGFIGHQQRSAIGQKAEKKPMELSKNREKSP